MRWDSWAWPWIQTLAKIDEYLLHWPNYPGHILSRFTIKDNKMDMASHKEVLRWEVQRQECCHHAGTLRFRAGWQPLLFHGDDPTRLASPTAMRRWMNALGEDRGMRKNPPATRTTYAAKS